MLSRIFLILLVKSVTCVVYDLNETEYNRMPALFGLDDYDPCVNEEGGVYCVAKFELHGDQNSDLGALIREYSDYDTKHFNHTLIERGICLNKRCRNYLKPNMMKRNEDLNEILEKCFNASIWRDYQLTAKLSTNYYCDVYNGSYDFDIWDGVFLIVVILVLMLNIFGTVYETLAEKPNRYSISGLGHIFLLSFSLRQNWKWFTNPATKNVKAERLQSLHAIRSIVTFLMVFSHSIFVIATFTDNPHETEKGYDKIYQQLIFNGLVLMQIVFVMSGFLLAYNLQLRNENRNITWTLFPKVIFLRLCRLGPANAVVVFFTMTWIRHLGSGPLWKFFVTESIVRDCRKYWWHHMLYINNYLNENSHCLIPTWHLAADTQLFIAGLLIHIATSTSGRKIVLGMMLVIGMILPVLHVLLQGLDPLVVVKPEFFRTNQNETFFKMHSLGHNNLTAYIVGMTTGYFVYSKQKNGDEVRKNKLFSTPRLLILSAMVYVIWGGAIFYVKSFDVPLAFKLVFAATQRLVMSGVTALTLVWLVFKFNETMCYILEWQAWVMPSRLTYAVFLIHMNIVEVILGQRTQLVHVSLFNLLMYHFAIVVLAFVIALPFHLTVEAPINRMVKILLDEDNAARLNTKKHM